MAEETGSYKPGLKNFEYLLEHVKSELRTEKGEVLRTVHGIRADHIATKKMSMTSTWIAKGGRGRGRGARWRR